MSIEDTEQKLELLIEGKQEIERFVAIMHLGLMVAIEKELLTCDEAEFRFFGPHMIDVVEKLQLDERFQYNTGVGSMELDMISRYLPEHYPDSIDEIKKNAEEVLKKLSPTERDWLHWVK